MSSTDPDRQTIYDLNSITDVFATELARIERIGEARRLIFTVRPTEESRACHAAVKVIVPAEIMMEIAQACLQDVNAPRVVPFARRLPAGMN